MTTQFFSLSEMAVGDERGGVSESMLSLLVYNGRPMSDLELAEEIAVSVDEIRAAAVMAEQALDVMILKDPSGVWMIESSFGG